MRGFGRMVMCLLSAKPFLTFHHPSYINHVHVAQARIACTEKCDTIISVWEDNTKRSVVLPKNRRVEMLTFVNGSDSLIALISSPDGKKHLLQTVPFTGACIDMRPMLPVPVCRASVAYMAQGWDRSLILVCRNGAIHRVHHGEKQDIAPPASDGVSAVHGTHDGILCVATFGGHIEVRDMRSRTSILSSCTISDCGHTKPVRHLYCRRVSENRLIVFSNSFGSSRLVLSVLDMDSLEWKHNIILDGEPRDITFMHIASDKKVFFFDTHNVLTCIQIGMSPVVIGRHAFVSRSALIDNIIIHDDDILIHNQGCSIHFWNLMTS